ncbi:GNAT family N-acetyltransferase [Psychrobacter sp. 2Y5]|uniref:GNAT family N-acetyltransferase n=1 Tax=unclassified Psychrobacter TaxID=196806 RepID=UPI003F46D9B0
MSTSKVTYQINTPITPFQFIEVLKNCSLGERRPIDNPYTIKGMLDNANLLVTAWVDRAVNKEHEEATNDANNDKQLIGVARCITDFSYCCYLSDMAVDEAYQNHGIGKKMIEKIEQQLPPSCKVILLSAPQATEYYPKVGFKKHESAWVKVVE